MGELKQVVWRQIRKDACVCVRVYVCVVVAGGGRRQRNPHQTIYYNDTKQEVQPLSQSHGCQLSWQLMEGKIKQVIV